MIARDRDEGLRFGRAREELPDARARDHPVALGGDEERRTAGEPRQRGVEQRLPLLRKLRQRQTVDVRRAQVDDAAAQRARRALRAAEPVAIEIAPAIVGSSPAVKSAVVAPMLWPIA